MSGGKRRSGFQITSVTSDLNKTPGGQSGPSMILPVLQSQASSCTRQGSSSQPTTPSLKRKYISHDSSGMGSSSRFRVVRLAVGKTRSGGRSESYHRGRWMCTDFTERQEEAGYRRVMDSMRHAHSLESLEVFGWDRDRDGIRSQTTTHQLTHPIRGREGMGLILHSGPPSPTQGPPSPTQGPINMWLLDHKQQIRTQALDSTPPIASARPRDPPPPRLDVDTAGQVCKHKRANNRRNQMTLKPLTCDLSVCQSVLRLSHSQPSSPPAGSYHQSLTPVQTPAAFSLDQVIFNLPGDIR
uniref:TSC22 domain family member 4 n=1 Tax=Mastacembelus armatus TaxID=205130 RepID=A0A3Q3LRV9_9TELE